MLYSRHNFRIVNKALSVLCALAAIWAVSIWVMPRADSPLDMEEARMQAAREDVKVELAPERSYAVVEDKDLFRSSRAKYVAPKAPKRVVAAPAAPPPPPPPKLTLVGTLLIDDGWEALVVYAGKEATYYKVGDMLQDFTIKKIGKDSMVLNRRGESVRYDMDKGAPSSGSPLP